MRCFVTCIKQVKPTEAPDIGWGLSPSKMTPTPSPTAKQTCQESECQVILQFRILVVSAVKICKQCLQTASASVGLDFRRPDPLGESPLPRHENCWRRHWTRAACFKPRLLLENLTLSPPITR